MTRRILVIWSLGFVCSWTLGSAFAHQAAPPPPEDAVFTDKFKTAAPIWRTAEALAYRQEWKSGWDMYADGTVEFKGVSHYPQEPLSQNHVKNPNLELRMYGAYQPKDPSIFEDVPPWDRPALLFSHQFKEQVPHTWNGMCSPNCAATFREREIIMLICQATRAFDGSQRSWVPAMRSPDFETGRWNVDDERQLDDRLLLRLRCVGGRSSRHHLEASECGLQDSGPCSGTTRLLVLGRRTCRWPVVCKPRFEQSRRNWLDRLDSGARTRSRRNGRRRLDGSLREPGRTDFIEELKCAKGARPVQAAVVIGALSDCHRSHSLLEELNRGGRITHMRRRGRHRCGRRPRLALVLGWIAFDQCAVDLHPTHDARRRSTSTWPVPGVRSVQPISSTLLKSGSINQCPSACSTTEDV